MTHHATPPSLALLACRVLEREIALLSAGATHLRVVRHFEVGLHDQPDGLRATLQKELDELDARADVDAIALAYGLCGCGTAGLRAGRHPVVIPRAHDCVTLFMGSKEAYAAHQRANPAAYYYTPGWNRERRVPGPDQEEHQRQELAKRYDDPEDVEFLLEAQREQWAQHDTAVWLDLGTDDAPAEADYARRCAAWLGWRFEQPPCDPALLRALLWGQWDDARFQIIQPGRCFAHSPDERILKEA